MAIGAMPAVPGEIPSGISGMAIAIAVGVLLAARPALSQKLSQTHPSTRETS